MGHGSALTKYEPVVSQGESICNSFHSCVGEGALSSKYRQKDRCLQHGWVESRRQFKRDVREFFGEIATDWTVLELGAYRGYTTRVLSEVFRQVLAA